MTSVCFGYAYGAIHPEFLRSVIELMGSGEARLQAATSVGGLYVDDNRNDLVRRFFETRCEWLWMLDADIAFPTDALDRLLAAAEEGPRIVGASYWAKHDKGNSSTWLRLENGHLYPWITVPETGLFQVGACGMGCTLVHRDVFEAIAERRRDNPDPWVWFGRDLVEMAGVTTRAGEDVSFCIRALRAGYATWGLCDLRVEHYKSMPVPAPEMPVHLPEGVR